ncbi:uncharacterized protein RCC_09853 [Ramularia collo-cygni]|uniref:Uncharacterized protein n=1 Tax=Ramularia collo-cygni TaxID=112498 RepID=A0A2D3V424_9PEZI|nr:uncharacterized protein RCC_09853 [Ramularia collo-cygni]CZT24136.1 uncharacterized protein RCC_09853 [Ramularia collo-cygni]
METAEENRADTSFCRMVGVACASLAGNLSLREMEHYDTDTMYATGMHAGYDKYFRRWKRQTRVHKDGVHYALLRLALHRLSKLRKIIFTDFRELTRPGEDYKKLCRRLFGNALEPDRLEDSPSPTDTEFLTFKRIVEETRGLPALDVSIRVHTCGSSQQQLKESLMHCCQPQRIRVIKNAQSNV